jgi:hypothetical protein
MLKSCLLCASLLSAAMSAWAQGTGITYQGQLKDAGSPANGDYDLTFAVFDEPSAGNQVGASLTNAPTPVSNGLFTVTLDFGGGVFDGTPRWLEIGVAAHGGADFVALSPRQPLSPTPYAIYAATSANVASGSVVASLNGLKDDVTLAAGNNVTLTPNGNTVTIDAASGGGSNIWSKLNNNAYYTEGSVGIGTNSPTAGVRLEVSGATKLNAGGSGGYLLLHTPSGESGMSVIGNNRADVRFDGATLKLLAGVGPGAMPSQNGIAISTNGSVGIGTTTPIPGNKLEVAGAFGIRGDGYVINVKDSSSGDVFYLYSSPGFNFLSLYGSASKNAGGTSWGTFSDRRLKQDVRTFEPGLNQILQLRPVRFRYRDDPRHGLTSTHEEVGFIAQEVREVIPDAVTEGKDGYLSLQADPIHWAAINAIKELNENVEKARAENAELKTRLEKLERLMNQNYGDVK